MSTERLLEIKEIIDNAKNKKSEVKGQISGIEDQMSAKFNIKTLPEAKKELGKKGDDLDEKEETLRNGEEKLENAYPWDNTK